MQKLLSIMIMSIYSFLMLFGAFSFHYENKQMGIMSAECHHSVCINIVQDINIWHRLLSSFIPFVKLFSVILIFTLISGLILYKVIHKYISREDESILSYIDLLFSRGILNPRCP